MGVFGNLFGKRASKSAAQASTDQSPAAPGNDASLIRVYDKYGRALQITREQWRTSVLPGSLQAAWNNPDHLYNVIVSALRDGLRSEIVDAANHLFKIDPDATRGACVWGIVLMEEERLGEAENIFRMFIAKHGEVGVVLTNLAKVYAKRGDDLKVEETLWRGLELDPNQENGLAWYEAIHRERGGEEAGLAAYRRVAAMKGSWRAQLWLARAALRAQQLQSAVSLYRETLARAPRPVPADALMQIGGDLGNAGHLREILQLVQPHFDVAVHGIEVGNNLIKATLDLGSIEAARAILEQLYAQRRPDWTSTLSYWDTEIAKAKLSPGPVDQSAVKVALLSIEGPVWLKPESALRPLFAAELTRDVVITFIGGSAEVAGQSNHIQHQLSDAPGRMSRALPLFLAEQVELSNETARSRTLIQWMLEPNSGFVLAGAPWNDDEIVRFSSEGGSSSGYIVVSHLKGGSDPWTVELRVLCAADGQCIDHFSEALLMEAPAEALLKVSRRLLQTLASAAQLKLRAFPVSYVLPSPARLPSYLLRLEQLLATRCGSMEGVQPGFLSGEREIIDGNIQLCLATPLSANVRLLLAETLLAMKRVRSDIAPEFEVSVTSLQREYPLTEPAQSMTQTLISDALGKS